MAERVNVKARNAALFAVDILVTHRDPTDAQYVDTILAAALPHLTAEDVPHVVAQVFRSEADRIETRAQERRSAALALRLRRSRRATGWREKAGHQVAAALAIATSLRARADQLDDRGPA